jgi:chaperone modulatory protein CbpM
MQMESTELIWLDEQHEISMTELIELSGFTQEELVHLLEIGALSANNSTETYFVPSELRFSSHCLISIRTLSRLKSDFELEQNALGLMLVFLERIRLLELQVQGLENAK